MIWITSLSFFYAVVGAIVFFWLSRFSKDKLDEYDRSFNGAHITSVIFGSSVFWPRLLAKPKLLFAPSVLLLDGMIFDFADTPRKRGRFLSNLPPCPRWVRYQREGSAELIFDCVELSGFLAQALKQSPHLADDAEGAILKWVSTCDPNDDGTADFPHLWCREENIASNAARAGLCRPIYCSNCGVEYPSQALVRDDDGGKGGWNFNRLSCPAGHALLEVRGAHFAVTRREEFRRTK